MRNIGNLLFLPLAVAAAVSLGATDWPFIVIRHEMSVNVNSDKFEKIAEAHMRHPGACDEFWFATGARKPIPELEKEVATFARYRPLCEKAGIVLSYQQGLTIGHGPRQDGNPRQGEQAFPEDAWQRRADGSFLGLLCPRSPFVLDYEREYAKAVIRVANPGSFWLDDDLRLGVVKPDGCFCDRCIAAFNAKTGGNVTREELAKRLYDKNVAQDPIREAWCGFNAESLAVYAAEVRKAADELGSPCRLGYQSVSANRLYTATGYGPLFEALSGSGHAPVGIRPGDGFYDESKPRWMIFKCLGVAREAERCRDIQNVASVCYEQETYPRHLLHKSPGAIMTECALALASGCDSLSLYWFPAEEPMPVEEYDSFLTTLLAARPYFERLAASTRRTRLGGLARYVGSAAAQTTDYTLNDDADVDLACAGIPVTVAGPSASAWFLTEKSHREMTDADKTAIASMPVVDISGMEKFPLVARRAKLLDDLDAATGGLFPVRVDVCRPLRILPRVRDDGRLDSVTLLNLSIGGTGEVKVRIRRHVSRTAFLQDATMSAPKPVVCADGATPDEVVVPLSGLGPWQIATLFFGE